ncbi:MAG: 16S rRNA (uracil(1498)-N(3))-methyltransferase [Acinetobacter sp.]|nr:16S rRNA (uracil(1498)-N(3))-methyltransferase [Acinetobacter sp.]
MNRFYTPIDLTLQQHIELPETVFHHWCRVLRANVGEQAIFFNGQGGEYLVQLTEIHKKTAFAHVQQFYAQQRQLAVNITLGQVMSKGDRMDYAIQKATELGVSHIQLLTSERCEMRLKYDRDQKKIEHWQGVAIAACEQSGLNIVPTILAPLTLNDWLAQCTADLKLVMALSEGQVHFPNPLPQNIALLVGPEGGLSTNEIALAHQHGFQSWTVGQRVLRTETAPVVALSILNHLCDMQGV